MLQCTKSTPGIALGVGKRQMSNRTSRGRVTSQKRTLDHGEAVLQSSKTRAGDSPSSSEAFWDASHGNSDPTGTVGLQSGKAAQRATTGVGVVTNTKEHTTHKHEQRSGFSPMLKGAPCKQQGPRVAVIGSVHACASITSPWAITGKAGKPCCSHTRVS